MAITLTRALRFDEAFDGPSWPDPLTAVGSSAVFGRAHLGPRRLLALLELSLGLGGPQPSSVERVAALVPLLRARLAAHGAGADEVFYARSFEADALGTAERLLRDRDRLALAGFDGAGFDGAGFDGAFGQRLSVRLAALVEATAERLPGTPERLRAVSKALERQGVDIGLIELCEPLSALPALWRDVLIALQARGVVLERCAPATSRDLADPPARDPAARDLGSARALLASPSVPERTFEPAGDGSLQLLRAAGPLAAARAVAAALAARRSLDGVVIVGGDGVLDAALAAQGLPRSGAARANVLRSVLPLALELGFAPAAPEQAQALLLIPDGPVPPRVARPLLAALSRTPAVDSDGWRRARAAALQGIAERGDGAMHDAVAATLDVLFGGTVRRGGPRERCYPRAEVERRLASVEAWARRRAHRDETAPEAPAFFAVLEQCRLHRRTLSLLGQSDFSAPELRRLSALVDEAAPGPLGGSAEAGLHAVRRPDALFGGARCVVWWNFTRASAPSVPRSAVGAAERAALGESGVQLPQAGQEAARLASRWARPLLAADEQLLLVCPRRGDDGEEQSPHPLWDELEARSGSAGLHRITVATPLSLSGAAPAAARELVALSLPPSPRRCFAVQTPAALALRDVESPSSLEKLGGCPLAWVLGYRARLEAGLAEPLRYGPRQRGTLAHELLHRLLEDATDGEPPAGEEAEARLEALFEREGPRLVAALFLPGREAARADVLSRLSRAARVLLEHLQRGGARLRSSEVPYARPATGLAVGGRPDLVLRDPPAVIDFKWGGRAEHERDLREGTAVQLAVYAWLVHEAGGSLPEVAYFILRSQDLLVGGDRALLGVEAVGGPAGGAGAVAAADTLRAFFSCLKRRRAELAVGRVEATGVDDGHGAVQPEQKEHRLVGGELTLAPPCHFCSFDALCGRGLGRGDSDGTDTATTTLDGGAAGGLHG